jgi:GDP-4-dehydro-6-deoxy-D-mannose reductase
MADSKILVLGATGFIGRNLVPKLVTGIPGAEIKTWSGEQDMSDPRIVEQIVAENPSIIIVAAGKSFVPESWENPLDFYKANTSGAIHIAEAARIGGSKVVFLSTFVYGEPYRLPIKETNAVRPFNPYASSKFMAEQILKDYYRHFGLETNVLRLFNVYGKGQRSDFLIPMLIEQYNKSSVMQVRDLHPKRDYVHIDDVTAAIMKAAQLFNGFQVYNVASGQSYSVADVIRLIAEAGGREVEIRSENIIRANEVNDTRADISKISEKLNWAPQVSFEEGIRSLLK